MQMVSNPNPNPYPIYIHLFAIYRDIHKCYYLLNILTCGTPYIWSCKIKLSIVLKFAHLKGNLLHVLCSSVNIHSTIELTTAIWLIFLQLRHAFGYGCRKPGWNRVTPINGAGNGTTSAPVTGYFSGCELLMTLTVV